MITIGMVLKGQEKNIGGTREEDQKLSRSQPQ